MRSVIIKKASQNEQQNQTITTNINYIQQFMSILKYKFNNKLKIETTQRIFFSSLGYGTTL